MPELPEVEVTRRGIAPLLEMRTIAAVHTTAPSYFFLTPPRTLRKRLCGRRILALTRHGKYLCALLDSGDTLVLHLGMTGQLFAAGSSSLRLLRASARATLEPEEQPEFKPDRHTHLRLSFSDSGPEVVFRDARKFGKVLLVPQGSTDPRIEKLGVDALDATGEELFAAARGRRIPIKTLLLDQCVLAGIGNIYADEGLFLAGVRPTLPSRRVSRVRCRTIADACRRVMLRSIETGGSSISDYVSPDGADGSYQNERKVYARAGEPCLVCGARIRRAVLGQRAAHFCPRCQT